MTGILGGNPKEEPMHYGEIFTVWQASMVAKEPSLVTELICTTRATMT